MAPTARNETPRPARGAVGDRRPVRLALILCMALLAALAGPADVGWAQETAPADSGGAFDVSSDLLQPLGMAVVFTVVGLILFAVCIALIVKVTPFSVQKEIEDDQNVALGIIIGAMILGIAIILAASIVG